MSRSFRDYARSFAESLDARKAYRWIGAGLVTAAGVAALSYLTAKEPIDLDRATYMQKVGMLWSDVVANGASERGTWKFLLPADFPGHDYIYLYHSESFQKSYPTRSHGDVILTAFSGRLSFIVNVDEFAIDSKDLSEEPSDLPGEKKEIIDELVENIVK